MRGCELAPPEIIKVCGITNLADATYAAQNGATALGFIFFPGSPRFVRVEEAAMIVATIPHSVLRVGVFVDESAEQIRNTVGAAKLDVVQLHGGETPGFCKQLGDLRIWKAFNVGGDFNADILAEYSCEAYLLDAKPEDGSHGGSGRVFPWPVAVEAKKHGRVIVSGGLDGTNVAQAIRDTDPYGVDASSRLESRPGVKDHDKVWRYLRAALVSNE